MSEIPTETFQSRFVNILLKGMLGAMWVIWAPIGFFLWIPLLIRTTLSFSVMVIHAQITGQQPNNVRVNLECAIDYWFSGFRSARMAVLQEGAFHSHPLKANLKLVVLEIIWATFVWLAGYFIIFWPKINIVQPLMDLYNLPLNDMHNLFTLIAIFLLLCLAFVLGLLVRLPNQEDEPAKLSTDESVEQESPEI